MKYLLSRHRIPCSSAASLALIVLPSIAAESHCPGSVVSVTPRFVQHALIVIPVRINQAGPFNFMIDTGSQVTVIDLSLASQLDLTQGQAFPWLAWQALFDVPWLHPDPPDRLKPLSDGQVRMLLASVPPGVTARHRGSRFEPIQVPDLISG
jgi:hypothetical protein